MQIEGLRGLAILSILVFHVFYRYQQIYVSSEVKYSWMKDWGNFGVCIFLLISCYYLINFNSDTTSFSLINYLLKKIIRLWPLYAIAITITAIVIHIFPLPERMSTWIDWLLNLTFINGFLGTSYVDGAHWYLTILISFFVISGIGKKFKIEKEPLFYFGIIALYLLSVILHIENIVKGGRYCFIFCFACTLRWFVQKKSSSISKEMLLWIFLGGISLFGIFRFIGMGYFIIICIITPCFLGCALGKWKFMQNKLFVFMGSISYSLYLIHQNIAYEAEYYLVKILGEWHALIGLAGLLVGAGAGLILYFFAERPTTFAKNKRSDSKNMERGNKTAYKKT